MCIRDRVSTQSTWAVELEKKSTMAHLIDRQQQLARRYSMKKVFEDSKLEDHKPGEETCGRKKSSINLPKPIVQEQNSLLVNFSTSFHPDFTPRRKERPELHKTEVPVKVKKAGCCPC
eukprot:TRINITY_DN2703_c0_g2_i1.p3 TRINITY_DN2703_c0_g2~~TRINITY_DN2703_c0_g2_i1.p3  ORF type:complete len:118 (-),score=20.46 TRINITY_DN2703_c0_g2_i1:27-380(-)